MDPTLIILLCALAAYLIGSIPFGLILSRAAGLGDIRKIGSGNIGATNVLRTGNKWVALLTLLLDFSKGVLAGLVGTTAISYIRQQQIDHMSNSAAAVITDDSIYAISFISMIAPILGHMFPIWLKFKGGKGVAVMFGVVFAATATPAMWSFWLMAATWLIVFFISRYSSLSALTAVCTLPISYYLFHNLDYHWPAITCIIALIMYGHHENIRRLIKGEENRFSFKK